jgi:hypothetical protein
MAFMELNRGGWGLKGIDYKNGGRVQGAGGKRSSTKDIGKGFSYFYIS